MENQEQPHSSPRPSAPQKTPETRLKEISQKAKQRESQNLKKPTSNQKLFNPTWFYIGLGGATIFRIAYLIFKEPTKIEYKFVPAPKNDGETKVKEQPENKPMATKGLDPQTKREEDKKNIV